jgi:TetR/AcrR family fatty acid metabolism transcriptional regulator
VESPEDQMEKKRLIVDTAIDLFAKNGFSRTKIKQIANEAGIGKGTVYLYFDNKSEILYEVFLDFEQMIHDILDRTIEDSWDPSKNLRRLTNELVDMLRANRTMYSVLFDLWSHSHNGSDELDIPFKSFYERIRKRFETFLETIIDEKHLEKHSLEEITYVLIGVFEGQMVQWLMNPSSPSLETMSEITITLLSNELSQTMEVDLLS